MVRRITIVGLIIYCMAIYPAFAGTWMDDFEDGDLDSWQRENPPMGGEIWNEEDGICSGQYANAPANICSALELKVDNAALWTDYSVVCRTMLMEEWGDGFFGIFFRSRPSGMGAQADYLATVTSDMKKALFHEISQNKIQKILDVPVPFDMSEDTWYKLEITAEGEHFEFCIDDELIWSCDDNSHASGTIWLTVRNAHAHFDDVVITGPDIPDGGPGFDVTSQNKLPTVWGSVKRGR